MALLTLRGRSEDRVKFFADHLRKEMDELAGELGDVVVAGPAPAPLLRAENFYRYQVMMRTPQMSALSRKLSAQAGGVTDFPMTSASSSTSTR